MSSILDKIKPLSDSVGGAYRKPSPEALKSLISALWGSTRALDYLRITRSLTDETIKHFSLGYDEQRDAIAIPVFKRGECVNIKYRFLEPKTIKYTQEKDCEVWIYNEDGIQAGMKKGHILIVEGEFDLMSCWQVGIRNVVSPASGKDSYGVWLELIDNIPHVIINYDNDKPGKESALKMAERIGIEKCKEIIFPEDVKDANDYFKKFTKDDYIQLAKSARPFYSYQFKGVGDIINDMRFNKQETYSVDVIPDVKIKSDYLMVVSGKTNAGKTSYVMNIADRLLSAGHPVLVLPFERGIETVGTRFLQVRHNYAEGDFVGLDEDGWNRIVKDSVGLPLYFAMPSRNDTIETIIKAKRIFDIKFVIIDHLDYMIRSSQNKEQEIGSTLQELKRIAEEHKIVMIVVTHIRKIEAPGAGSSKKPHLDDLKGSSSLQQDPECVIMLSKVDDGLLSVDVLKNKGKMTNTVYSFNLDSGKINGNDTKIGCGDAHADFEKW